MPKINWKIVVSLMVVAGCLVGSEARKFMKEQPDFFKSCHLKAPDFYKCYRGNLQQLIIEFKNGVPGLPSAGSFNPVKVRKVKIRHNEFKINLRNVTVHGIGDTLITKVQYSLKNLTFVAKVHVPSIRIEGLYKTDGYLMFIPMNGRGNMSLEVRDSDFYILFKLKAVDDESSGLTFQELQSVQTKIRNIGNFRIDMGNLFNGASKQVEQDTNDMLNSHWRDLLDVLQPTLEEAISAIVYGRFKKILHFMPAKYFIADLPTAKEYYSGKLAKN